MAKVPVESALIALRVVRVADGATHHWSLSLPAGSTVAHALALLPREALQGVAGTAIWGVRSRETTRLQEDDRLELLEALGVDPQQARRRRAVGFRRKARAGG